MLADDLFSGAGGWELGARNLGIEFTGYEINPAACATRIAAGMKTVKGDVRDSNPVESDAEILLASPPCQTFSIAGKGTGRLDTKKIVAAIEDWQIECGDLDESTALMMEPLRWILLRAADDRPYRYIAMEQVPGVLPIWWAYECVLRTLGYSVEVANVNSELHGVPQTRKRAFLVAALEHDAWLPEEGVRPAVMADVLPYNDGRVQESQYLGGSSADPDRERPIRRLDQPAFTVTTKTWRWMFPDGTWKRCSNKDMAVLQTFPSHPWRGLADEQRAQIGNAVPPVLAEAVLSTLMKLNKADQEVACPR